MNCKIIGSKCDEIIHHFLLFVLQNDILMGTLTVRENLAFSANLRLSRKEYSSSDKKMRVDSVIQELGLKDCADTKVMDFSLVKTECWKWFVVLVWTKHLLRLSVWKNWVKVTCASVTKTISKTTTIGLGRYVIIQRVMVGMCPSIPTRLYIGLFSLRLGQCFCVVFLVERRRGAASVWSSSLPPPSCSWMSPPQAWTPTLPTPSWNCCRSTTRSYQIYCTYFPL